MKAYRATSPRHYGPRHVIVTRWRLSWLPNGSPMLAATPQAALPCAQLQDTSSISPKFHRARLGFPRLPSDRDDTRQECPAIRGKDVENRRLSRVPAPLPRSDSCAAPSVSPLQKRRPGRLQRRDAGSVSVQTCRLGLESVASTAISSSHRAPPLRPPIRHPARAMGWMP